MDNVEIVVNSDGKECVVINNGDGSFTSMLKSTWDELEAAKEAQSL